MTRKKVLLKAPLLTNSGYGVHSRQLFEWLYKKKDIDLVVECLQWGRTSWILNEKLENGTIGHIMSCSKPYDKKDIDVAIQVQLPDEWDENLANKNIGVTAAVETDKCNSAWLDSCNKMDTVVVPSKFTKNVIKRSGIVTTPIVVIPESFNNKITNRSAVDKALNSMLTNVKDFIET